MTTYAELVAADGAVAHLPLTEATGPTSGDLIGGHDGTWYDSPTPGVSGPIAGETALTFAHGPDGPFVLLANPGTLPTFPGPFSWEVWFMLPSSLSGFFGPTFSTATTSGGTVLRDALMSAASPDSPFLSLHVDDSTFFAFSDGSGPDEALSYDGGWHHLVYTCDAAGATAIYLDGVAIPNDGAPTGWTSAAPTAAVIGGQAQNYDPGSYPHVGAFAGSLAHLALYPAALRPCQVLSHFDLATTGTYTPCPEWLRLGHKSGQGYWQSKGDVTEEWAGGVRGLLLPLPTLSGTPALLLGKDPTLGVPAFCPPPVVVKQYVPVPTPLPPAPPPTGTTATCGAATQMADWLEGVYRQLASWVGGLESTLLNWTLDLLINVVIDALTGGAGLVVGVFDQAAIASLAVFVSTHLLGTDWPSLTTSENDIIRNTCYCALGGAMGSTTISGSTLSDWCSRLDAENIGTNFPSGVTVPVLKLVILCPGTALWQQYANTGAQNPSSACSGVTCP